MKKPLYKSSSLAKKKKSPSMRQMLKKSAFASLTAVTLITTLQFNTDAKRNGHENPLSFAQNIEMKVAKEINQNVTKIVSPTADAATVSTAVTDTSVPGMENAKKVNLVLDYGADPTGEKDSSDAWIKMLKDAEIQKLDVFIPEGNYMLDPKDHNIENYPGEIKGLRLIGAGKEKTHFLYRNPGINKPEFFFSKIFMEKGAPIEIAGFTVDGSEGPQNQYHTMSSPQDFYKTEMYKGFYIKNSGSLSVHDMNFQHMYGGYTIMTEEYNDVRIKDVTLEDVGGDDLTDSFGMGIYLGGHTGNATIGIDRYVFNGKLGDKEQYNPGTGGKNPGDKSFMGWIGVVYENGTIQNDEESTWLKDQNTTINITNSKIMDVETTFHVESTYGHVYFNVDNLVTRAKDYFIAAGVNGEIKERSNNVKADLYPFGRNNIVKGIYYTEKEFDDNKSGRNSFNMYNSEVNYLDYDATPAGAPGKKDMYMGTSYGDGVEATYTCTTFNSLPNHLVENGGGTFVDSAINLWENNPFNASADPKKDMMRGGGDDSLTTYVKYEGDTTVNKAGEWKTAGTCQAPDWFAPDGTVVPDLEEPIDPGDIGTTPTGNAAPVLTVKDIVIEQGSDFDPLQDVSAMDDKDQNLVIYVDGIVDTSKPGEYIQKITVKDGEGAVSTGQRKVTVTAKGVPTTEEPTTEKPTTEEPTTEEPTTEKPTTEKPTTEEPTTEKPTTENPTTETPTTEQPTTPDKENQLPQIFASDLFIMEGTDFDPLKNVKAYDHEDGNLTKEIKVIKNTVDTSKPGTGEVVYEVTDPVTKLKGTTTVNVTVGKDWTKDMTGMKDISDQLKGQLDNLTKKYDELNSKYDVNTKEIESIKAQIKEVQDAIAVVEKETTKLNDNYDNLKTDSDAMREQVNNVVKNIEEVTQLVNALNEKYNSLKADLDKATDGKAADDATIKALQDGMVKLNDTIKDLQEQINKVTAKLDMPQSEIETKGGNIIITNTNTNKNDNGKTSTETKSDSNSDDAKSTNTNNNDSDDKATAEEPIRTDDKSDEDKAATATPSKDDSDKSDDNATKEGVTTEEPEKDGEQNNETKDKSVESAAQKTDESATEIVTTEQPTTEQARPQSSTGILPDTGSAWSNAVVYGGAALMILGLAGYYLMRRKQNN